MTTGKLIAIVVSLFLALIASLIIVDIETVEGHKIGVLETWGDGVVSDPLHPKTYYLFPGWSQTIHQYELTTRNYVMNDKVTEEKANGREKDSYVVQSKDSQDMRISMNISYRLDPSKIVDLHKTVRNDWEENLLRPRLLKVVKDEATTRTALEAYSGDGLVELQRDIFNILSAKDGELAMRGLLVENFVIEHIGLDPTYTAEITQRQIAIQTQLRAVEQTKAATALAEKAKADAQADYEKVLVEARRDKEKGVLAAEQKARQEVIAAEAAATQVVVRAEASAKEVALRAEAEKRQAILVAEGEKEAGILKAFAIEALGAAEAEAQKLRLSAYAVPGADAFVKIEVAKNFALGMSNIKGVVPADMKINVFSENFNKGISILADGK